MPLIITFLGKGGTGRTTSAIATAKKLATEGKKVLLLGQDPSPAWGMTVGITPTSQPQEIGANLSVMQLNSTVLLENSWEQVKKLEAQYLRSPILKQVYGQELGILPGMDRALALNVLREHYESNLYDVLIYDGTGGIDTLRMLGMPDILSWYFRRFGEIFTESDIVKTLSPFVQPITSAVLNTSWTANDINSTNNPATQMLNQGTEVLNQGKVLAYLVTTPNPTAVATAKYLWGSAQQIGLSVGGVLVNQGEITDVVASEFAPLKITNLPAAGEGDNWQNLIEALPSMSVGSDIPKPTEVILSERKIKVFLPGFEKKEVKLTQYGPEITIEAGDQRRNITLPPAWRGNSVAGAKFQNGYLEITIG